MQTEETETQKLADEPEIPYSVVKSVRNEEGNQTWRFTYKQPNGPRVQDYIVAEDLTQAKERTEILINMWLETQEEKDQLGIIRYTEDTFGSAGTV